MSNVKALSLRLFSSLVAVVSLLSCGNGQKSEVPAPGFADYIEAYTGGVVSSSSTVRIEFAVTPDTSVPADGLFSFSPSLKGAARWVGGNMIEFVPEAGELQPGTEYSAGFRLNKVFAVKDKSLQTFSFKFAVSRKRGAVDINSVTITAASPEVAAVCGQIRLSEPVEPDELKPIVRIKGADSDSELKIEATDNACTYDFTISPIARKSQDRTVSISIDGGRKGFRTAETKDVTIPATGSFRVLSADISAGSQPYVTVVFSEALDSQADGKSYYQVRGATRSYAQVENNILKVYYENLRSGDVVLDIFSQIKDYDGVQLGSDWTATYHPEEIPPQVEILASGNILPDSDNLVIPFRAANLSAVDVKVIRIYGANIMSFLQNNEIDGSYELRRSGRMVCRKTIRLDSDENLDLHGWNNFSLDLSGLFKQEKGAIYRVKFSFNKEYSLYETDSFSGSDSQLTRLSSEGVTDEDEAVWDSPDPYYYDNDNFDWRKYDWDDRDNPLTDSYYMQSSRFPSINLLTTQIGLMVKRSDDGNLWLTVNNLLTAEPMSGVELTAYNYQLRPLASVKSDADGFARMQTSGKVFLVCAKYGDSVTYLKMTDGLQNSLSRFDTGGKKIEKGLKGYVYGERGVWRPGDTLHLVLLVDSRASGIPEGHPAKMELYTPQGQFHSSLLCRNSVNGFYAFEVPTRESDPTGTWNAYFKIGGASFHKALPIETIKANRLKINFSAGADILEAKNVYPMSISSNWLTGPAASGLKAKSEIFLRKGSSSFKSYDGYVFADPLLEFTENSYELLSGTLDAGGSLRVNVRMPQAGNAPGMLNAEVVSRVTEPGGDESIVSSSFRYSPYKAYVGVRFPKEDGRWLETDTDNKFKVAVVDCDGNRVRGHRLEYRIYKMSWDWWWESSARKLASYVNSSSAKVVASGALTSASSDSEITFRVDYPVWGRYLLYVKDLDSNHASGGVFFCDWPAWRGRADKSNSETADMLSFSTDKKSYQVGEEATVYIPAADGGMALVSYENGSGVLAREWVKTTASEQAHKFRITSEMAPNCYIHITLLRPYGKTAEGQVIRMYGVQPVLVEDSASHLDPVLTVPEVIRPQKEFSVKVKESGGRKMTYTLAIVDEGILDLTSFKTPDPWSAMYARQALGISTWDMYGQVIGAGATGISSMFSIGGDESVDVNGRNRDRRFNPVVKFYGPFKLAKGENTHRITLPMYVGSVRVMVVAGQDGAFGNAQKTVPVRNPLMVLSTAPRILGPGEEFSFPVNVFAMEDNIRDVKVSVSVEGPAEALSSGSKTLTFGGAGDQLCDFRFRTTSAEGVVRLSVKAVSGSAEASETVSVTVRNPNKEVMSISRSSLDKGGSITLDCPALSGNADWARLEIAGFPSIDFNGAFSYMYNYSHLCTEQLSARGIAMVSMLKMLDETNQKKAQEMIPKMLQELYLRQLSDGSFAFWPGSMHINTWATVMAGHFMALASEAGYSVSSAVFGSWKNYAKKTVRAYRSTAAAGTYYDHQQAYTLYVLALAGSAENGAMNRLKETPSLSTQAAWTLASAYTLSGRKSVASQMAASLATDVPDYSSPYNFASPLRDRAMILESLVLLGQLDWALPVAESVASSLKDAYYTTQTTAFAAVAMSRLYDAMGKDAIDVDMTVGGKTERIRAASAFASRDLPAGASGVTLKNNSDGVNYVTVVSGTVPAYGTLLPAKSSGLGLDVRYESASGAALNPASLRQGTEFNAIVRVTNLVPATSLTNLALAVRVPSGWEIFNDRLFGASDNASQDWSYRDIRDDSVTFYTDLAAGKSKEFKLRLTAAYEGDFVLPQITCEAMYDNNIFAATASGRAKVTK